MLFNSFEYLVFLPLIFSLYWILPNRFRWILLFIASYYFYMSWNVKYVVLILFTTVISYCAALLLERIQSDRLKKGIIALTLTACLGVLFFFKYFNFLSESVTAVLRSFAIPCQSITLNLLLPVGISFYTFQTLGYVIDVYRGRVKAEKHFGIYATFISFFPQLVAGPIERTGNLLPQINKEHHFSCEKALYGAKLMLWGYYKKLVVADVLAPYVDTVYANPTLYQGFDLLLAILFFAVQIYCDFSAYSDIAIGTAKLLDIDLMTNFRTPYFSSSIKEFWSRWHISLSTWFKDYVYIPLGGNRCTKLRHSLNLLITFLVSGLWHGASWTFVIWGLIHGLAQVAEGFFAKPLAAFRKRKAGRWISVLCVFTFCCIAWVFFRAGTFSDAFYILSHTLTGITQPGQYLHNTLGISNLKLLVVFGLIFILALYDLLDYDGQLIRKLSAKPAAVQWAVYLLLGLIIIFCSQKGAAAEFVYFQF